MSSDDVSQKPPVRSIAIEQLSECLQTTQMINDVKVAIIDVRDNDNFQAGHLRGAIHVPLDSLQDALPQLENLKSQPVVVVCKLGMKAKDAYARLKEAGFSQLYCLEGGMTAWREQGLPVDKT